MGIKVIIKNVRSCPKEELYAHIRYGVLLGDTQKPAIVFFSCRRNLFT